MITLLCGLGHVGSSVLIGLAGIAMGSAVASLQWFEGLRGGAAGWLLLGFGLAYMLWGIKKAVKGEKHSHTHSHGAPEHAHPHGEHASVTPWALFIIFILGPCEPLIPLLVYADLKGGMPPALAVAAVFSLVTLVTMMASVFLLLGGIRLFPAERMERYPHALAGFAVFACGVAVKAGL